MPTNKSTQTPTGDPINHFPDTILGKENGVKKTKTPRNYDSILKGALALSFSEKVELRNELNTAIEKELEEVRTQADEYLKLANKIPISKIPV